MPSALHESMVADICSKTGAANRQWPTFFRRACFGVERLFAKQSFAEDEVEELRDAINYNCVGLGKIRPDAFTVIYEGDAGDVPVLHCWEVSHSTSKEWKRYSRIWSLVDEYFADLVVHVVCAETGKEVEYCMHDVMGSTFEVKPCQMMMAA